MDQSNLDYPKAVASFSEHPSTGTRDPSSRPLVCSAKRGCQQAKMVEDGLVLAMMMIMSEQEDFGRLCARVRKGGWSIFPSAWVIKQAIVCVA